MPKDKPKNPHAVALGKRGGEAGRGDAKRRSKEQMQKIGRLSAEARKRKKQTGI